MAAVHNTNNTTKNRPLARNTRPSNHDPGPATVPTRRKRDYLGERARVEALRARIAELRLRRMPLAAIAKEVGRSISVVRDHIEKMKAEWRRQYTSMTDEAMQHFLSDNDGLFKEALVAFDRSRRDTVEEQTKVSNIQAGQADTPAPAPAAKKGKPAPARPLQPTVETTTKKKSTAGNPVWLERAEKLLDQRGRALKILTREPVEGGSGVAITRPNQTLIWAETAAEDAQVVAKIIEVLQRPDGPGVPEHLERMRMGGVRNKR